MHVTRGLRQALALICGAAAVALATAGLWWVLQDGGFRVKVAIALVVIAGLIALTGGTALNRGGTAEMRVLLGTGPDHEEPTTGAGLTGVGVFLFVSLPLFVAGGLLYGTGTG
jgi:hypothetical protein